MSRRVQLVLLCEDNQHEAFARRFLNAMGWETRAMRVEKAPGGRGAPPSLEAACVEYRKWLAPEPWK